MKYMSFVRPDGSATWGRVIGDTVLDLGTLAPSLREAMAEGKLSTAASANGSTPSFALSEVRFLPVIPNPDKIICVGLNYRSHIIETGRELPTKPAIFTRFSNTQIGHMQDIVRPEVSEKLDFEGELAIIVSAPAYKVSREDAFKVIGGFACYNDGSVRDWQRHTHQFTPGKNFPNTGALGPWMVTADEFKGLDGGHLLTRLNGEEVQRATLDDMMFDVPYLIEYCSTFTKLEPGDVIITGTTGGVGAFRKPPLWLKPGDVVEVEIEGIGVLRNGVADEVSA
jgi:2-keto-4-pentenoate hydratase/2-oxohepta-3-ene-1,7-dioic acid hydratase in catechol pathway